MNVNRRNYPPDHGIRVPYAALEDLVIRLFKAAGMPTADAQLLAGVLTRNNQRCIYSHGTGQIPYYLKKIRDGHVNPAPNVTVVSEAPAALVLDGDGGLGYFPCQRGTQKIIEKAKVCGIAALTTRNHQHVGSAGNYTRLALEHDCIGLSTSGHRGFLTPKHSIFNIMDSSPISVAIPAGQQPPLVMDMGGSLISFEEELFKRRPATFFKAMALSAVIRSLGGVFPGIYRQGLTSSTWESNQGAFIAVVNVAHFMPIDDLKSEMDRFIHEARQTKPVPGMDRAELAGGNEWQWERDNLEKGIPMSDDHCQALQTEADQLGVDTPFSAYEDTRF